jgi:hypothetical protein
METKTYEPHLIARRHLLRLTRSVFFNLSVDIWARLTQLQAVWFLPKQPLKRRLRTIQGPRSSHLRGDLGLAVDNCQDLLWNWDPTSRRRPQRNALHENYLSVLTSRLKASRSLGRRSMHPRSMPQKTSTCKSAATNVTSLRGTCLTSALTR